MLSFITLAAALHPVFLPISISQGGWFSNKEGICISTVDKLKPYNHGTCRLKESADSLILEMPYGPVYLKLINSKTNIYCSSCSNESRLKYWDVEFDISGGIKLRNLDDSYIIEFVPY